MRTRPFLSFYILWLVNFLFIINNWLHNQGLKIHDNNNSTSSAHQNRVLRLKQLKNSHRTTNYFSTMNRFFFSVSWVARYSSTNPHLLPLRLLLFQRRFLLAFLMTFNFFLCVCRYWEQQKATCLFFCNNDKGQN